MIKYFLLFLIIIITICDSNLYYDKNYIPFMTIFETIEFNIKLFFINLSGITYINKYGSYILEYFLNDKLLINFKNKLEKKYNNIVISYIITKYQHYFILNNNLVKQILLDSPFTFSAGYIKENSFKKFMPNNVGLGKCYKTECPWKNQRIFNENVLGTNNYNYFLNILPNLITNILDKKLININDFKKKSYEISSLIIYGNVQQQNIIKKFIYTYGINKSDIKNTKRFYNFYIKSLKNYNNDSLLKLTYIFRNNKDNNVINDQIPHWFGPFVFIISFLIPSLLCIIINFKDIYSKLLKEINNDNFDIFSKNSYLHFCVIEHIRLFNTININLPRTVNEDINYYNIHLKKNNQLFMIFSPLLRDKNIYHNANYFKPERWQNKSIEEQNIVFGIGSQQCPSIEITPIIYKSIVYTLLKKFNYNHVKPKLKSKELYFINPYSIEFN